jgi:hypothetical protein
MIRQVYNLVINLRIRPYTTQALPMAYFSGKSVTETISCTDAITKEPTLDDIVFTTYYEIVPHFNISAGFMVFALGRASSGDLTAS